MAKKAGGQGESIGGYFRKLFVDNPKLLRTRSNSHVLGRWLEDHPGHREVPLNVNAPGFGAVMSRMITKG